MNKLVARSLEILGQATKEMGREYTSNLTSFINDAKDVKNSIVKSTTDASDTFAKLKTTNITKKISDWFYQEENSYDSPSGEEFDAGFKIDSSDDPKLDGESKTSALSTESMRDIAEKQSSTMLKIGRRQTEQSVANTAEIISVVNSRTSEMIASMNNINKSLIGISDRLDKLIKLQTVEIEEARAEDKGGLYSDGNLSLMRIFEASKQSLSNNSLVTMASSLGQMVTGGGGPVDVAKFLMGFGTGKKLDVLGGQSIDEIGKRFNEAIGTATQTVMNEIINSGGFKKIFGDITSFAGDKDYGTIAETTYNTKKAMFDGMTRMSIVNIIPEYLSKINQALTGETYHVDQRGRLVKGPVQNKFGEVTRNAFSSTGLSSNAQKNILSAGQKSLGDKISSKDIDEAARALTGVIVIDMHTRGQRSFTISELKSDMTPHIINAVKLLCQTGRNDPSYWGTVCQTIILQLSNGLMDSSQFIRNINQSLENTIAAATSFAQSGKPEAAQAGKLTLETLAGQWLKTHESTTTTTPSPPPAPTPQPTVQQSSDTTPLDGRVSTEKTDKDYIDGKHTQADFIRGIFGILNRGVNVKVLSKKDSSWKFDDYELSRKETKQENLDNKAAELFGAAIAGGAKNDDDVLAKAVKKGMSDAFSGLTGGGGEGGSAGIVGGKGGGFFSNMFSTLGAASLRDLTSKVINGEFKGFFKEGGKGRELLGKAKDKFNELRGKASEAIPGSLKYDKRVREGYESITGEGGLIDRAGKKAKGIGGKISDALSENETFQNIKGSASRFANNAAYNADSLALNSAQKRVENFELSPEMVDDVDDRVGVELAIQYIKQGDFDNADTAISCLNSKQLKQALSRHVKDLKKIKEVKDKRASGEEALAGGQTPDIGAVLQTAPEGDNQGDGKKKSGIISVVQKGFGMVGKALGKLAQLAAKGVMDITFGLKNMAGGLFGNKLRDADGNVLRDENGKAIKSHGLVQNLTTDVMKLGAQGVKALGSKVGNAVGNMQLSRRTGDMTVREGIGVAKNKILNTTFTGRWERDENGNVVRDEDGKKKMTNTSTIGDLLKKPGETLAKSLSNIAADIKNSKLGEGISKLAKKIADSKLGQAISGIVDKIKNRDPDKPSLLQRAGEKVRSTRIGAGFLKGFDEAKAAKNKMNDAKERMSSFTNRSIGTIMDVIQGKSDAPSAFSQLMDVIKGFHEDVNENHEEEIKKMDEQNEATDDDENAKPETQSTVETGQTSPTASSDTSTTTPTEGAKTSGEGGSTTSTPQSAPQVSTPDTSASSGGGSSGGDGGGKGLLGGLKSLFGDIMGNIGQMLGGFTQALMGIGELVLSIVMGLEGLQALKDLVMSILTDGLEPLNEIFYSLMDLIKPIVATLKDVVSTIADTVVTIAKALIDAIQPIIEAIQPIIQTVLDVLTPILEIVTVLVDVIMVPIMITLDIISPIIEGIGYTLEIVAGALQIGMGIIIGILGMLLKGIGLVISAIGKIPGLGSTVGKLGESLTETADGMIDTSKTMITSGAEQMKEGIQGIVALGKKLIPGGDDGEEKEDEKKDSETDTSKINLSDEMGAGNVNTSTINNSWTYTYGSGNTMNQHTYGNYMNMSERGCGPVALADAYNRRTGDGVNPATLASRMMGSGTYEPGRGTSVSSMVRTGNAMGMGMRVGGVTQSSLKQASPTNPITLLGSGAGFGTKMGNNHYVNVIGTDSNGGAYVSNPMTGRVERQSATSLTLNSKLGLYGSGDNEYEQYGFDEDTASAFENLKNLTSQLTAMFMGESKGDKINKERDAAKAKQDAEKIKIKLGDDYDAIEQEALEAFKSDNPKRDGEDDEAYESRIAKLWESKGASYIVKFGGQAYADKTEAWGETASKGIDEAQEGFENASESMKKINPSMLDESATSFTGAIMAPYAPINYIEPEIDSTTSGKSPVHDFFSATSGSSAYTIDGGWFNKTDAPVSKEGEGSKGNPHEGIAISFKNPKDAEVHAITGGTVSFVGRQGVHGGTDPNGGLGNHVKWRDASGMYHWYMHLNDIDENIQEGSNLEPGQLIGHVGDTGASGDKNGNALKLLRYVLTKSGPYGNTGDEGYVNPLTYWRFEEGGSDELTGGSEKEQIYNYLINTIGLSEKGAAGVMGVFQEESTNTAGTLEGNYAFDANTVKSATKSNASLNSYSTDKLFPMYANSGVGIDKNAYKGTDGNYYPGFGLAQWTGPRGKKIMDFAKSKGTNWEDLVTQLMFIKEELSGDYSGLVKSITDPATPEDAADAWMTQYEAGGSGTNPFNTWLSSGQISARRTNASKLYSELHGHVTPASTTVSSGSEGGRTGRFVSTINNNGGDGGSLLRAVAQVFEAAVDNNGGQYSYSDVGPVTLRDGTTLTNFRQDCSGLMSAAIKSMGYTFNAGSSTGITTYDLYQRNQQDLVMKDGSPSPDWEIIPYAEGALQSGDIVTNSHHVGMYISGPDNGSWSNRGFDGGSSNGINNSGKAGKAYLDGDSSWQDKMHYTHAGADGLTRILRYVGGINDTPEISNPTTSANHRGGFTNGGVNTVYMGAGPFQPDKPGRDTSQVSDVAGPSLPNIVGKGDVGDYWYDSIFSNNNVQAEVPDIDPSKFETNDSTGLTTLQQFVQKYEVKADNSDQTKLLDKMSKMTFNVRAQRVEELLEELIEKLTGDEPDKSPSTDGYDPNLFENNGIPEPITRLSKG